MQQGNFIDIFLLHQVGISHYFMMKMHGQTNLKFDNIIYIRPSVRRVVQLATI